MPSLFFKQIKGIAKPIKTVLGTSQVLLLIKFLSRNDLKPENPKGNQADKYDLSCVVIAFGKGCQEIMNVQSQLLFIGSSAKTLKLWWQNERGFADWKQRNQHTRRCPPSALP